MQLDIAHARTILGKLGEPHCSALSLRYLDGLPVPDISLALGRTVHATEAVLVRARNAFRIAYDRAEGGADAY